tara:strand:- start:6071 stop:6574 length:504 start_codon:yes stop_codon:yes gene_type:complete
MELAKTPEIKEPVYRWDEKAIKQIVRDMGLKVTQQRLTILECILRGRDHITAQELYEAVQAKDPNLGFATVYRFLKQLTEQEYVSEVRMGGLPARYEWARKKSHHDHLTCKQCGSICEFENQQIEDLQEAIAKSFGYILTSHVLELYGICPECQKEDGILPGTKNFS